MRLYIEGHEKQKGYAISREWSDAECSKLPPALDSELMPIRHVRSLDKAKATVLRYNRRFATH